MSFAVLLRKGSFNHLASCLWFSGYKNIRLLFQGLLDLMVDLIYYNLPIILLNSPAFALILLDIVLAALCHLLTHKEHEVLVVAWLRETGSGFWEPVGLLLLL